MNLVSYFTLPTACLLSAEENNLTSISSVTIELGEVSGVVDSYLTDCWRWTAEKHDLLRGCKNAYRNASRRHFVRVLREDVSDRNLREGLSVLRQRKDTPGNRK